MVLPPWAPAVEAIFNSYGRLPAMFGFSAVVVCIAFWGASTVMTIPALIGTKTWKIQPGKSLDVSMLLKSMPLVAFNATLSCILIPLVLGGLLPDSSFDWQALPSMMELTCHAIIWLAVEEVVFFYTHRWLHENKKNVRGCAQTSSHMDCTGRFCCYLLSSFRAHCFKSFAIDPWTFGLQVSHCFCCCVHLWWSLAHHCSAFWVLVLRRQRHARRASCEVQCQLWCPGTHGQLVWYIPLTHWCYKCRGDRQTSFFKGTISDMVYKAACLRQRWCAQVLTGCCAVVGLQQLEPCLILLHK